MGVIIYTFFGGLKATFFADYLNAAFIFIVVLIFVSSIYFTNPHIGGISGMYDKLTARIFPKTCTRKFSCSLSYNGFFGSVNFWNYQYCRKFWNSICRPGILAEGCSELDRDLRARGFLVGGLAWFAIPFTLATTLGLSAVATQVYLTPEQINNGLVAPTAASSILGDIGAVLLLTMLFTAVTSAGSAELVAVSSLVTYDIFRTYVKPSSSGRELMRVSNMTIIAFGLGMGLLASILLQIGASLQYMYLAMGILIGSVVIPISLSVVWNKTNKVGSSFSCTHRSGKWTHCMDNHRRYSVR